MVKPSKRGRGEGGGARRAQRGVRKFVVRVINNQEIRGWQGTKRGSNGYATRTENSTINIFRGVAAHLSLSLSLSLFPSIFIQRGSFRNVGHTFSLSLSLSIYPFCGERRAVKSFMNFKQGPLSSNRARSFLIFPLPRWREGDR